MSRRVVLWGASPARARADLASDPGRPCEIPFRISDRASVSPEPRRLELEATLVIRAFDIGWLVHEAPGGPAVVVPRSRSGDVCPRPGAAALDLAKTGGTHPPPPASAARRLRDVFPLFRAGSAYFPMLRRAAGCWCVAAEGLL
jgi:hypothetical protein